MKISILIAEDDDKIRRLLKDYLINEGYEILEASNGKQALELFYSNKFHLILLDVMMPFYSGFEVLKEIRRISDVPCAFITARSEEYDQLEGFNIGADDYILKPFSPKIIVAKINKLLERTGKFENNFIYKNLNIDFLKNKVLIDNTVTELSPKEFELLITFIQNKNIVLSRERLLDKVWGYEYDGDLRTVDTHVKRVRKKIGENFIKTIRGIGYIFEVNNEKIN